MLHLQGWELGRITATLKMHSACVNGLSQDVQDDERPEDSVCDLCIFVGDSKCFINIFWTNKWKLRSCSRHRGLARCIHKELVMFS